MRRSGFRTTKGQTNYQPITSLAFEGAVSGIAHDNGPYYFSRATTISLKLPDHLLKREGRSAAALFELPERGVLRVGLEIGGQVADLRALMSRYRDRPRSLADDCLVR